MKWLVLILLTLLLGLLLGPVVQDVPGTLLLIFDQYSIQFRLWQGLVMLVMAILVMIFVYHLVIKLAGTAGQLQRWSGSRRFVKARQKTIDGMIALAEGHWAKAEKLLSDAASKTDTALINYLAAALAAEQQNAHGRRDQYLRLAHLAEPSAEIAVGLTQGQLQFRQGQIEEALATLTHLQRLSPKHGPVLLMLSQIYQKLGDWQRLNEILPDLRKTNALTDSDFEQLSQKAWLGLLVQKAETHGAEGVQTVWNSIPKKWRQQDMLELNYYSLLIKTGASLEAAQGLMQRIKKDAAEPFLELFDALELDDLSQQLKLIEKLGDKFNHSYSWSLTAGKLAMRQQIWGQAKNYLQQAVNLKPTAEARQLLAMTLDAMGQADQAYQELKANWPTQYRALNSQRLS